MRFFPHQLPSVVGCKVEELMCSIEKDFGIMSQNYVEQQEVNAQWQRVLEGNKQVANGSSV